MKNILFTLLLALVISSCNNDSVTPEPEEKPEPKTDITFTHPSYDTPDGCGISLKRNNRLSVRLADASGKVIRTTKTIDPSKIRLYAYMADEQDIMVLYGKEEKGLTMDELSRSRQYGIEYSYRQNQSGYEKDEYIEFYLSYGLMKNETPFDGYIRDSRGRIVYKTRVQWTETDSDIIEAIFAPTEPTQNQYLDMLVDELYVNGKLQYKFDAEQENPDIFTENGSVEGIFLPDLNWVNRPNFFIFHKTVKN